MRILLSILIAIAPTLGFAQSTGKVAEFNATMGTQSITNYVVNPNAEKNTAGVTVTGTGSSVTASASDPFFGTKSFRFGGTTGNTIVGTFAMNDFDNGMTSGGTNCYTSYWLSIDSNGTMTVNMKLAGVTKATQTIDATVTGTTKQQYFLYYACGDLGQDPTLEFSYAAVSGNGANLFNVDEVYSGVYAGPSSMSNRTNEATYTPTYTGFGAVPTSNMKWYVDGGYLYIYGSFVVGTPTGVEARLSFPTGYTSASSISTLMLCGDASRNVGATDLYRQAILCEPNVAYITFGNQTNSASISTKATGTAVSAAGNTLQVNAKIPIAVANNSLAIPAFCINNPDCQNNFSAKVSATGVVTDENYGFIAGNCTNANPFVCTWDTSRFSVAPTCVASPFAGGGMAQITATSTTSASITTYNTAGSANQSAFNLNCSRAGTDVKPWGPIPLLSGMVSSNSTSSLRMETAVITNGATCAIASQTGSWATGSSHITTGTCEITYASSTWSAAPTCFANGTDTSTRYASAGTPTTTAVRIYTVTTSTLTDAGSSILCIGPR